MRQGAGAAVSLLRMPKPRALIGPGKRVRGVWVREGRRDRDRTGTVVGAAAERSLRSAPGYLEACGSGPPFVRFPGGGRRAEGKEATAGDLPPRGSLGRGGCRCPRSPAGRRGSARGTERRKRRQWIRLAVSGPRLLGNSRSGLKGE
ncbi:hypothetical protein Q9966_015751 [Columba livia]|nr:hypothetical protein Q9966_015751 [Columba livia]